MKVYIVRSQYHEWINAFELDDLIDKFESRNGCIQTSMGLDGNWLNYDCLKFGCDWYSSEAKKQIAIVY
jgi:hypothetical protein